MTIHFKNNKIEKLFNSISKLQKVYGMAGATIIRRRLDDMRAATVLEDVRWLPGKYHELTGNRTGQLSVHVEEPYRLIFEPSTMPLPVKADGGLNWKGVDSITILEIVNYHD